VGQLIGLGDKERRMWLGTGTGDKKQRRETRDRGRETRNRDLRLGQRMGDREEIKWDRGQMTGDKKERKGERG
jgi:hypothetical protein